MSCKVIFMLRRKFIIKQKRTFGSVILQVGPHDNGQGFNKQICSGFNIFRFCIFRDYSTVCQQLITVHNGSAILCKTGCAAVIKQLRAAVSYHFFLVAQIVIFEYVLL